MIRRRAEITDKLLEKISNQIEVDWNDLGIDLTDEQLEQLQSEHPEWVYEQIYNYFF